RPRLLEQVTGDVGARVDREQRFTVLLVVEAQAQTVRVHGEVDGAWQLAREGDELDGLARRCSPSAPPVLGEARACQERKGGGVLGSGACAQAPESADGR